MAKTLADLAHRDQGFRPPLGLCALQTSSQHLHIEGYCVMRTDVKVTVYTVHVFNIVHNELNTFK